jgi:hypothetical protein
LAPFETESEGTFGLTAIGMAAFYIVIAYWLWDWLWHWFRGVLVFAVTAFVVVGLPMLFVAFDRLLRQHQLTFSVLWVGVGMFAIARFYRVFCRAVYRSQAINISYSTSQAAWFFRITDKKIFRTLPITGNKYFVTLERSKDRLSLVYPP